jgi:hypothetical protein
MHRDVMAVGLLEDALILEATVQCLVTRPRCALHAEVLLRVTVILGALAHVAVVGLHPLA